MGKKIMRRLATEYVFLKRALCVWNFLNVVERSLLTKGNRDSGVLFSKSFPVTCLKENR